MGFPSQEYWSGLPFPSPGNLPDPRIEPVSPALQADSLPLSYQGFQAAQVAQLVKNLPAMWETWVRSVSWEDPLEKGKGTHSRILAWRVPWTVQSMGSQRVGHN